MPDPNGGMGPKITLDQEVGGRLARLADALEEASAFALVAAAAQQLPPDTGWPEDTTLFRFLGAGQPSDLNLFRDEHFAEVLAKFGSFATLFSVVYMVAALEDCLANLLLIALIGRDQRGGRLKDYRYPRLVAKTRKLVRQSSPRGLVHMLYDIIEGVAGRGARLHKPHLRRLDTVLRRRDCIAHRHGRVERGFDLNDGDSLTVALLRPALMHDGREITAPGHRVEAGDQLEFRFREEKRSWRAGETLRVEAGDCQYIAMTLYLGARAIGGDLIAWLRRRLPAASPVGHPAESAKG